MLSLFSPDEKNCVVVKDRVDSLARRNSDLPRPQAGRSRFRRMAVFWQGKSGGTVEVFLELLERFGWSCYVAGSSG